MRISNKDIDKLPAQDREEVQQLLTRLKAILNKGKVMTERECPICHTKFTPKTRNQKTCLNKHCRAVYNAQLNRNRLFNRRMTELGKEVDERIGG